MEFYNVNEDELSVFELNQEEVIRISPIFVYLSAVGLFGIPGNAFVIFAFRRSCRGSNSHLFFVWLAIIDLLNSSLVLPFEFVNVFYQYTYDYEWLCKFTIFFSYWLLLTSGMTLTIISVDRFRKVCRSLKWQISNLTARVLCLVSVITAFVVSTPVLLLYGIRKFTIVPHKVIGKDCAITNGYEHSIYVKIYNGFLWILFVSTFSVMILLYVVIGRQILKQTTKMKKLTMGHREYSEIKSSELNPISASHGTVRLKNGTPGGKICGGKSTSGDKHMYDDIDKALETERQFSTAIGRKNTEEQKRARKTALIMLFVSLAFMISFLPYLILRLWEAISLNFVTSMTDTERAIYKSFLRSYWLNCALNPFIYCACAPQFRKEFRNLWKRIRKS